MVLPSEPAGENAILRPGRSSGVLPVHFTVDQPNEHAPVDSDAAQRQACCLGIRNRREAGDLGRDHYP